MLMISPKQTFIVGHVTELVVGNAIIIFLTAVQKTLLLLGSWSFYKIATIVMNMWLSPTPLILKCRQFWNVPKKVNSHIGLVAVATVEAPVAVVEAVALPSLAPYP